MGKEGQHLEGIDCARKHDPVVLCTNGRVSSDFALQVDTMAGKDRDD